MKEVWWVMGGLVSEEGQLESTKTSLHGLHVIKVGVKFVHKVSLL